MAEVINLFDRVKTQEDQDDDIEYDNAKVLSKETFYETLLLLEELGYDADNNSALVKDLEALAFLASSIIFRQHGNPHPGSDILSQTHDHLIYLSDWARQEAEEEQNDEINNSD